MSLYRNVVWFTKGMAEYTKQGYESAAKSFRAADMDVDLADRSIMVTGANSGIGKICALEGKQTNHKIFFLNIFNLLILKSLNVVLLFTWFVEVRKEGPQHKKK